MSEIFDIANILSSDAGFEEQRACPISDKIGKTITDSPRNDATLYAIVATDNSHYALVLEVDATAITIFDGSDVWERPVRMAVEETYNRACIEVSPSILYASIVARTRQ